MRYSFIMEKHTDITEEKKNGGLGLIGSVMAIMLLGKVLGLLRSVLIAGRLGTETAESVAFNFASQIPRNFLDVVFASAITSCFIPVFNSYLQKKSRDEAARMAGNFISVIFVMSAGLALLAMAAAPAVAAVYTGDLSPGSRALTQQLLYILLPTIVISAAAFSLTGVLQSLGEFRVPAAMSVSYNLIVILYCFFFMDRFGVYGLAAAFLLGWLTQVAIQLPSLKKRGFVFRPAFNLRDEGLRRIARLMPPVMVSSWLLPINIAVNMNAAAGLYGGSGAASAAISYANELYSVITGVFILSVANVIFQSLSKQQAAEDADGFAKTMKGTLRALIFILLPMTAGLMVLGRDIVSLFYERNNFTAFSTDLTAGAMICFAPGMLGLGFQTILSRGFFAEKNGRVPMITSLAAIAINFILSFTLTGPLGAGGPALASSIAISVCAVIMFILAWKRHRGIADRAMLAAGLKALASACVMAVAVFFARIPLAGALDGGFAAKGLAVAGLAALGAGIYMACAFLLRIEETGIIVKMINEKLKRKN